MCQKGGGRGAGGGERPPPPPRSARRRLGGPHSSQFPVGLQSFPKKSSRLFHFWLLLQSVSISSLRGHVVCFMHPQLPAALNPPWPKESVSHLFLHLLHELSIFIYPRLHFHLQLFFPISPCDVYVAFCGIEHLHISPQMYHRSRFGTVRPDSRLYTSCT